jgi:hypothetical protein
MSQLYYASDVRDLILETWYYSVHLATLPTKSVRAKTWNRAENFLAAWQFFHDILCWYKSTRCQDSFEQYGDGIWTSYRNDLHIVVEWFEQRVMTFLPYFHNTTQHHVEKLSTVRWYHLKSVAKGINTACNNLFDSMWTSSWHAFLIQTNIMSRNFQQCGAIIATVCWHEHHSM